jgi:hypothetical protein
MHPQQQTKLAHQQQHHQHPHQHQHQQQQQQQQEQEIIGSMNRLAPEPFATPDIELSGASTFTSQREGKGEIWRQSSPRKVAKKGGGRSYMGAV